ncbi:hypothetical protein AT935_04110, partial [Campylobacter jejuni]
MLSLNELKELYDFDLRASQRSFYEFHQSLKYYHGDQIDPVNLQTIHERRQSPVIENIFKLIINKIIGYKAQSIAEIKVSGRQENDHNTAILINDILKVFSEDISYNKEIIKRDRNLIFGLGLCELWCEKDADGDFFLSLKSLDPLSFLIDAYSEDLNALDARRFHKKLNMSFEEAKRLLKTTPYIKNQRSFDQRCILIESWIKEEQGFARYIWQEEALLSYEKKPFKNGMHPFIVSKFNIDEKGVWYGLFRDIKPLQDYINYSENKMMNMIGTLKAFFEEDAILEAEEFIKQASLDNAVVKVRSGALRDNKLKFVEHHNDIATISAKANEKRNLAKMISGLNDEALGIANNRMSNDAISQRREAGLMGLQEYLNACDAMDRLIFKKAIDYISLYFTKKQVFQISDERVGQRYFSINENENNQIKVGKFDLSYKSQIKTQSNEEKLASWAEIIKSFSHDPNLMSQMMLLMLKDVQSTQAKERVNSKQGLIKQDLEAKEKELKRKEALFEKRLENENIFTKSLRDTADNLGLNAAADVLELGLNKLGLKDENYIFESEKEDIKKRALKSVREKLENNEEKFSESEKYALRDKYDELDYKKALDKEKEKLRLIQKDSGYHQSEVEFMEEELGFFHTLFNDTKDTVREFKDAYKSEGIIGADVQKAINVLKQFEKSELLRHAFSDKKQELQQEYLKNALVIAELNGFDDVGLSKENELYFIKKDKDKEQKYLVNTGFLDNFWDLIENSKFEIAGGIAGGIKGFNSGKSAKGKVVKSILGAAAGSFGGGLMDAKIADMYLNRESDYSRNLEYALQAGLLSLAGDGVIIAAKPMVKGAIKGAKGLYTYAKEHTPLGLFSTIPSQNINAANKIIDEVFTREMKEELKQAQKDFGGGVRAEALANPVFEKLKQSFAKKYGKEDKKTKSVEKLAEIFNQNSLKTKQQEMLDLIRSDKDGSTLAYLLEVAKDDVKIQNNLKNMLNLASANVEKNLKNLNINPREIKSILDEFEAGNKAAFKEVENQIAKLYNEDIKVVLDRNTYENIKEDFLQNGVNLDEMTPFLRDLENNVFSKEGVSFSKLNNFRKNLNYYIFNKDKTPNFINTLKKIAETSLKAEIDKGIDNIFKELPKAYESIKELYSTSLKDYAAMKELNESIKNLKLQDSAKSADEVVDSLIKYAKGQGEGGVNNLQKIKAYLGEENNAFLEMQILNRLFKESMVENDRAKVRVFDSESFLNRVKELVGDTPVKYALNKDEAKLFLENLKGAKIPEKLNMEGFLKELESVENKENFISHLSKKEDAKSRLAYLNLVKPTLEEADLILHNGKRQDYIKKFRDEKGFYTLLITEENGKRLITFLPKTREDFIRNKIDNASLIQSFTS